MMTLELYLAGGLLLLALLGVSWALVWTVDRLRVQRALRATDRPERRNGWT